MARRKSVEKQQSRQRTATTAQQKGRTEYTETVNKRNIEINRIQKEQAEAQKKGGLFGEGGWMSLAGTILAIAAVTLVTQGTGTAAFIASGGGAGIFSGVGTIGAALIAGTAAGAGTWAGMKVADAAYDQWTGESPEEAMLSASDIQTENLHRGTYGSNYSEVFNPLTNLSKSSQAMADDYAAKKAGGYVMAPLTAGVTTIGQGIAGAYKTGFDADANLFPWSKS